MKYIFGFALIFVSFVVFADPQIDHRANQYCHFPKDQANTDFEDKMPCKDSRLVGDAAGNIVAGYAIVKSKVPEDFVPPKIVVQSDGTNGVCNLHNDDNRRYPIADWIVKISGKCVKKTNGKLSCTATHEIICGTGDDGYVE